MQTKIQKIGAGFGLLLPKELLLEGRLATAKDFAVHPPHRFVQWVDRWARKREAEILRKTA